MNRTKQKGLTLIELLVASAIAAMCLLGFGSSLVSYYKWQDRLGAKIESFRIAAHAVGQISKIGRYSDSCQKIVPASGRPFLECSIEFIPGEVTVVQIVFDGTQLSYLRNGEPKWSYAASGFSICTGDEMARGMCSEPSLALPASPSLAVLSLQNYFRFKIDLPQPNGDTLPAQGAFFVRNSNPNEVRYVWAPMGGD